MDRRPSPSQLPDVEIHNPATEDPSGALWDWGDLLDFTADDHLQIPIDFSQDHRSVASQPEEALPKADPVTDRVRKRDPKLVCSNFLAGRVPCACPEIDAMMEEEEAGTEKKRARRGQGGSVTVRCQVPGCGADISELKGYHRRHRVCLPCANSGSVEIDGGSKRYCQQCGKFHVLTDFDEGKRSCRRKLERHNHRRRRKQIDPKFAVENEFRGDVGIEEVACDDESRKDALCLGSQSTETETLFESEDGPLSCLDPDSHNIPGDPIGSFMASVDAQVQKGEKMYTSPLSTSQCDNKSAYSSMCPTGRISFKLYDWNPAEFPRRLRHQIFEWLASMPVELEGYIRPGCTILTVFVAMPKCMWEKLLDDPLSYVHGFFVAPEKTLFGRANVHVYLNNMIFRVARSPTCVMKVNVHVEAPRLHYVHPTCFEAGKPIELVACGSNLLQSKYRFLVSFSGKYLKNDSCVASSYDQAEGNSTCSFHHQFYKIFIPNIEPDLLGPAFIEVENEYGLSNFIPVLIGDKEICSEVDMMQQRSNGTLSPEVSQYDTMDSLSEACEVSSLGYRAFSEFILDIAWLLKQPVSENYQQSMNSSQIQRFISILHFLIHNEMAKTLERVLDNLTFFVDNMESSGIDNGTNECDMRLLQKYIDRAISFINPKLQSQRLVLQSANDMPIRGDFSQSFSEDDMLRIPVTIQDTEMKGFGRLRLGAGFSTASTSRNEILQLLNGETVMDLNHIKDLPRKSCGFNFSRMSFRPTVLVISMVMCFGICAVIIHPRKVAELAITVRGRLFNEI